MLIWKLSNIGSWGNLFHWRNPCLNFVHTLQTQQHLSFRKFMVNVTKPKNDTVFRFLLHRNSVLTILISKIEYERECRYKLNRLDFNLIIFSVEIEKLTPSFHPNIIFSYKFDPVSLRIMSLHNEILVLFTLLFSLLVQRLLYLSF